MDEEISSYNYSFVFQCSNVLYWLELLEFCLSVCLWLCALATIMLTDYHVVWHGFHCRRVGWSMTIERPSCSCPFQGSEQDGSRECICFTCHSDLMFTEWVKYFQNENIFYLNYTFSKKISTDPVVAE